MSDVDGRNARFCCQDLVHISPTMHLSVDHRSEWPEGAFTILTIITPMEEMLSKGMWRVKNSCQNLALDWIELGQLEAC